MSEVPSEKDPPGDPIEEKDSSKEESQLSAEAEVSINVAENELKDPETADITQPPEAEKNVQVASPNSEDDKLASAGISEQVEEKETSGIEEKQKKENPLEVVGSWFQGLVKNNPTSVEATKTEETVSQPVEAVQESIVKEEDPEKDGNEARNLEDAVSVEKNVIEEETVLVPSTESVMESFEDEDLLKKLEEAENPQLTEESGFPLQTNTRPKSNLREKMGAIFGKSKPKEKGLDIEQSGEKTDEVVIADTKGKKFGSLFGRRLTTSKETVQGGGLFSKKTVQTEEKSVEGLDDVKKPGGLKQNMSTYFGNNKRRMVMIGALVLVALATLFPTIYNGVSAVSQMEELLQADIVTHPLYKGTLFPFGQVTLRFDSGDRFLITFRVEGLERDCQQCTWSIVEGNTCHDVSKLGDTQYYDRNDPELISLDPFNMCYYKTSEGMSDSTQTSFNGYNLKENENHALVMFDSTGSPVACGILKRHAHPMTFPRLWANIASLPMYKDGEIQGKVRLDFYPDNAFHFGFQVNGLPSYCPMCAVSIHVGTSCNESPGDHFWNPEKLPYDPWGFVNGAFYQTDRNGTTVDRHGFYLYDGFPYDDHMNHVVILSDKDGNAIACGELRESSHYAWKQTETAMRQVMQEGDSLAHVESTVDASQPGIEAVSVVEAAIADSQVVES